MAELGFRKDNILSNTFKAVVRLFRGTADPGTLTGVGSPVPNVSRAIPLETSFDGTNGGRLLSLTYEMMLNNAQVFSSLSALVANSFQPFDGGGVIRPVSKYKEIEDSLNKFFAEIHLDTLVPKLAFDLLHQGNIVVRHIFDDEGVLVGVEPVHSWADVVPFVNRGDTLFYINTKDRNVVEPPWKYSYTQLVTLSRYGYMRVGILPTKNSSELENSFTPAESWLRRAVEPWRRLEVTRLSLVSMRIDALNYKRILFLPMANQPNQKNSAEALKFYAALFSGTRSRNLSPDGLQTSVNDFGAQMEIVLPYKQDQGKPEIQEIGTTVEVRAIADLEEHSKELAMALRTPKQYAGYDLEGAPGSLGESPTNRLDEAFGRASEEIQSRILALYHNIAYVRLLSEGFDIERGDFRLLAVNPSTVDDEKRRISARVSMEGIKDLTDSLPDSVKETLDMQKLIVDLFDNNVAVHMGVSLKDYLKSPDELNKSEDVAMASKAVNTPKPSMVKSKEGKSLVSKIDKFVESRFNSLGVIVGGSESSMGSSKAPNAKLAVSSVLRTPDWYKHTVLPVSISDVIPVVSAKDCGISVNNLTHIGMRSIMLDVVRTTKPTVPAELLVAVSSEDIFSLEEAVLLSDGKVVVTSERDAAKVAVLKARGDLAVNVNFLKIVS